MELYVDDVNEYIEKYISMTHHKKKKKVVCGKNEYVSIVFFEEWILRKKRE